VTEPTEITIEVTDGVAVIVLNRPDRLNAFTTTMAKEIVSAFDTTDADDDVRVVVLTGAGRGFCAGADLASGGASFDPTDERRMAERAEFGTIGGVVRDGGGYVSMRIAASRKPVIAAVNGAAVGVGATMTLPADIRIASESARFGFVFARRGLVPEGASSWFLPRIVGISQAMEWVATGRIFDAAEALDGGLVSRVVPHDDLMPTVRAIAAEIAQNTSAVSVSLSRTMLWSMLGASSPWEAHRLDSRVIVELGKSNDVVEGVNSFRQKRQPAFIDRVGDNLGLVPPWPARADGMT
jgi:enoyl-CoA hydratase/carnithine racemase